jgi:hypothetical protein
MASLLLNEKQILQTPESTMPRKKIHYVEVIPLPTRRAAKDRHIGAVIEVIVGWICVLACAALLILLSGRSAPAADPGAVIFSKKFSNEFDQTGDKKLNVLRGDHRRLASQ